MCRNSQTGSNGQWPNRWLVLVCVLACAASLARQCNTQLQPGVRWSCPSRTGNATLGNEQKDELVDIVKLRSAGHRNSSFFALIHRLATNDRTLRHATSATSGRIGYPDGLVRERDDNELPEMTASYSPDDKLQLEAVDNFLFQQHRLQHRYSVSDHGFMALLALAHSMTYRDLYMHLYDTHTDLRSSMGPKVNGAQCLRQLEEMVVRVEEQEREKYYSTDLNLYRILDTWGHVSSGILLGNVFFTGMYHECQRMHLQMTGSGGGAASEPPAEMRYCVLTAKHVDWPQIDKNDILGLKAGVCIPKACDSTMSERKAQLLMRLVAYQLRRPEEGQVKFTRLYCLPDEDSPARSVWSSRASSATLVGLCLWLALLAFATYKHSGQRRRAPAESASFGLTNMHCATSGGAHEKQQREGQQERPESLREAGLQRGEDSYAKIYQILSVAHNLRLLFDTSKESSLMETGDRLKRGSGGSSATTATAAAASSERQPESCDAQTAGKLQPDANGREQQRQHQQSSPSGASNPKQATPIVDLRYIEGIKVIAMSYVIMGHVLMCIPAITYNSREFSRDGSMAFFMANLVPAFAVNSFFTITGLLTCYLILKQNQSYPFVTSPTKWFAFIVYRYLRIMPLYALVVLYCKTLAKFTGSGPLWDYGTSSLSQRRACEQDPWANTLLFKSNFLPPLEHCIPGGWYLANDFQFFLVTPLYLALLARRPRLGELAIIVSIAAGYLAGFHSIYSAHVSDLRPIANFSPHGFKTYISHFSFNYTRPQYRLPAYLIGLLMGHKLFLYEASKRAYRKQASETYQRREEASKAAVATCTTPCEEDENGNEIVADETTDRHLEGLPEPGATTAHHREPEPEPDWSPTFKCNGTLVCAFLVTLCCFTPVIGSKLPFTLTSARVMVAFITPSYHVLFSLAIGLYLLLATTGYGSATLNNALGRPFWKPLARLSLCAVLVNVEVINYIVQNNKSQQYVDIYYHVTLNCLCILTTYAVSTAACVLIEAPIRGALNGLLTKAVTRVSADSSCKAGKQKHR